jgi:glycosyltransferase involved in cell wall biosynthesis
MTHSAPVTPAGLLTLRYSSLIRTFNSENTLTATLHYLSTQTLPPHEYIFVDSGSVDNTSALLPPCSILHRYTGADFNFADAINQGLKYASTDYVLIISSHTLLRHPKAIEFALTLLGSNTHLGAAYFCSENNGPLRYEIIDSTNFNGWNGLWNTCSLVRMELLRRRQFRPEVFIAEDQEWAQWLFHNTDNVIARISGAGMDNSQNPRGYPLRKRLNETVAIAYFANRELLSFENLMRILYQVIKLNTTVSVKERFFNLVLLFCLVACYVKQPKYNSKYFK